MEISIVLFFNIFSSRLVEASGASVLVNQCFKFLQKGAELVLIGLHRKELKVDDYLNDIVFKSLTLHTVHGRRIFQVKCYKCF